jgi:hypothetical protein
MTFLIREPLFVQSLIDLRSAVAASVKVTTFKSVFRFNSVISPTLSTPSALLSSTFMTGDPVSLYSLQISKIMVAALDCILLPLYEDLNLH